MLRNKAIIAIMIAELALALALITNSIEIIRLRYSAIAVVTGLREDGLYILELGREDQASPSDSDLNEVLAALESAPHVVSAAASNAAPLMANEWPVDVSTALGSEFRVQAAEYVVSKGGISTLGLTILSGQDFAAEDYMAFDQVVPNAPSVILTKALATRLFPGGNAVGSQLYLGSRSYVIVGVVGQLTRPSLQAQSEADMSLLMPARPSGRFSSFILLRASNEVNLEDIRSAISSVGGLYARNIREYPRVREELQERDWYILWTMFFVAAISLFTAVFGIYALSSLWVRQRIHGIALRRVLGATRDDILMMVIVENQLICLMGILLGVIAAATVNHLASSAYGLGDLRAIPIVACSFALMIAGLASSIPLARSAAATEPAAALRRALT
jgi:putative ABC transport system permease protein